MSKGTVMVTTTDNPFNPFVDWESWKRWDEDHGYYTMNYLARIAIMSDDLPDEENDLIIDQAIDEIVEMNITGKYIKVFDNVSENKAPQGDMVVI
jgi:hypothetical protein